MSSCPHQPSSLGRLRGFTLIELMVTVMVAAIMLGIGIPSFRSFIAGQKVKTASYDLVSSLMLARSEAVKRNTAVTLTAGSATAWGKGWTVSAGATSLYEQQAMPGVTITPKDPANPSVATSLASVDFGSSGRPASKAYFEITGASTVKCIKVDPAGVPSSTLGGCS
jgi:type IV fimbrial biogenesis protein FimT